MACATKVDKSAVERRTSAAECALLIGEIAAQLGVEGETERETVTDIRTEGTGPVIRFPVSQAALKAVEGSPAWSPRAAELIYL